MKNLRTIQWFKLVSSIRMLTMLRNSPKSILQNLPHHRNKQTNIETQQLTLKNSSSKICKILLYNKWKKNCKWMAHSDTCIQQQLEHSSWFWKTLQAKFAKSYFTISEKKLQMNGAFRHLHTTTAGNVHWTGEQLIIMQRFVNSIKITKARTT